jgi:hypothetical protein
MLRDFLATTAALARAGRFAELGDFIAAVLKIISLPPDQASGKFTIGPVTQQPKGN